MRGQICRACTSHKMRRNRGRWEKGFSVHGKSALRISQHFQFSSSNHSLLPYSSLYLTFLCSLLVVFACFFSCLSFFYYCCYSIIIVNSTVLRILIITLSPYRSQRSFVLLNLLPIRHSTPVHSLKTASFVHSSTQLVRSDRRLSETKGPEPLQLVRKNFPPTTAAFLPEGCFNSVSFSPSLPATIFFHGRQGIAVRG